MLYAYILALIFFCVSLWDVDAYSYGGYSSDTSEYSSGTSQYDMNAGSSYGATTDTSQEDMNGGDTEKEWEADKTDYEMDKMLHEPEKEIFYAHKQTTKDPKIISYEIGQESKRRKDQRFCNGYVVQNNEISLGPIYTCPNDMISRPMLSKINCEDITRCKDRECCVPRCMNTICSDAKPFAFANMPCIDLQGDLVDEKRNCVPEKCCSNTPNHCDDYLKFNACPNGLVPNPSLDLFLANETDYESLCCAKPANCETFLSRYGCPLGMEDINSPASQVCGLPFHAELSESIFDSEEITDFCSVELCCSPLPEPDLNADWAAASVEEPDYHAEFVGHFLYNTDQLIMYNATPGNTHLRRVEHCRVACAYKTPNGIESSSWGSFGRATGFVLIDDKQCLCQRVEDHAQLMIPPTHTKYFKTNQMNIIQSLVLYEHERFETYTLAPVRTATYTFSKVYRGSNGKCANKLFLNGTTEEVERLDSSDPLYNADPQIECMNRCIAEHPTSRGFWTEIAHPHKCACASDSCETVEHNALFQPYEMVAEKHLPECRIFPETRNDIIGRPRYGIACLNCTDNGPDSTCLEWAYLEPVSEASSFSSDHKWSCDNFTSCTKCTETECLEISCLNGRSNPNRNVTDKCEAFCTDDDCHICDVHDPDKCIQKKCSIGEFTINPNGIDGTHRCDACPAGQYGPDGISCHLCKAGQYQNETGSSQCLACAAGKYASTKGMKTPCIDCPPTTTVSSTGNADISECKVCDKGYHVVNSECVACEAGKYELQGSCVDCPHGTRSEKGNYRGCMSCQGGASVHNNECFACPRGRFRNTEAICQACPQGWQQPFEGTTKCEKCPQGRFTFYEASATCFCLGNDDNCPSPIKLLPKEKIREKLERMLHRNTDLIQPFLDILGVKCIEDITESHGSCQTCVNQDNSPFKCLHTESVLFQDVDKDGVANYRDFFPQDPTEYKDSDGDGVGDVLDELPFDPNETKDLDKDGIGDNSDPDRDGDGYVNIIDTFPNDSTEWTDLDGDNIGDNADVDRDNDGYANVNDTFPNDPAEWSDLDQDGIGDNTDTDRDNDGFANNDELYPDDPTRSKDSDQDGVDDLYDAFPNDPNEWDDTDGDGIGSNADTDDDGDGVPDDQDLFPLDPTETVDNDGDGIGDNGDPDDDNDGHLDVNDDFPFDSWRHKDSDGDGVEDPIDVFPYDGNEWLDTDGDGGGDNGDTYRTHPDRKSTVAPDRTPEIFVSDYADTQLAKSSLLELVYEAVPYKTPDLEVLKSPLAGKFSQTEPGKFCANFVGPEGQVLNISAESLGYGNEHRGWQTGYTSVSVVRPYEGCTAERPDYYRYALENNFIDGNAENSTFSITINGVEITGSRANREHVCHMSTDRRKYECSRICREYRDYTKGFILETSGRCRCLMESDVDKIEHERKFGASTRVSYDICIDNLRYKSAGDDYECHNSAPYSGWSLPFYHVYGCRDNEVVYPGGDTTICLASAERRTKECADACRAHDSNLKGFNLIPSGSSAGRCYCSWAEISSGMTGTSSTYYAYDFAKPGSPDELQLHSLDLTDSLSRDDKIYECMLRCQTYDPRFSHFMVKNSPVNECACATDNCIEMYTHDSYIIYEVDSPYMVVQRGKTCSSIKTLGERLPHSDSLADPNLAQECANRCSIEENMPFFVLSSNDDVCRCGVECESLVDQSEMTVYKIKDVVDDYPVRKVDSNEFQSIYLGCRPFEFGDFVRVEPVAADAAGVESCLTTCKDRGYDYGLISETWGVDPKISGMDDNHNFDLNLYKQDYDVDEFSPNYSYGGLPDYGYWSSNTDCMHPYDFIPKVYVPDVKLPTDFTRIDGYEYDENADIALFNLTIACAKACSTKSTINNTELPEAYANDNYEYDAFRVFIEQPGKKTDTHYVRPNQEVCQCLPYGDNTVYSNQNGYGKGRCRDFMYQSYYNRGWEFKKSRWFKFKEKGTKPLMCQCSSSRPAMFDDEQNPLADLSRCSANMADTYRLGDFKHSAVYEIPVQPTLTSISEICDTRCQTDVFNAYTGFKVENQKCYCTHTVMDSGTVGTNVEYENFGYVAMHTQNLSFTPKFLLPQVLDDYVYGNTDEQYTIDVSRNYWCNDFDAVAVEPETDRTGDYESMVENCKRACTNNSSPISDGGKSWSNVASTERIVGFYIHNGDGNAAAEGKCACLKSVPSCNTPTSEWDLHVFVGEECETITGPEINSAWDVLDGECASGTEFVSMYFSDCEEQCYVNPNCTAFSYHHSSNKTCKIIGTDDTCSSPVSKSDWKTYVKLETLSHRESSSTTRREFKWIKASNDDQYCKGAEPSYYNADTYPFRLGQLKMFEGNDNNCAANNTDCHVTRCGLQCYSGLYGPAGRHPSESQVISFGWPDGFGDVMKGFFVDRATGECYCTTYMFEHCGGVLPGSDAATTTLVTASNFAHYDYQRECKEV